MRDKLDDPGVGCADTAPDQRSYHLLGGHYVNPRTTRAAQFNPLLARDIALKRKTLGEILGVKAKATAGSSAAIIWQKIVKLAVAMPFGDPGIEVHVDPSPTLAITAAPAQCAAARQQAAWGRHRQHPPVTLSPPYRGRWSDA